MLGTRTKAKGNKQSKKATKTNGKKAMISRTKSDNVLAEPQASAAAPGPPEPLSPPRRDSAGKKRGRDEGATIGDDRPTKKVLNKWTSLPARETSSRCISK